MTTHLPRVVVAGAIWLVVGVGCRTAQPRPRDEAIQRLDEAVTALVRRQDIVGLTVVVMQDDRVVYERAWGFSDLEARIPMEVGTAMQIGSISKIPTAVAIVCLSEQGKLSLDDPISEHLPNLPAAMASITVRQLLEMTSGIPEYVRHPDYVARDLDFSSPGEWTRNHLRDFIYRLPLDFTPGTRWAYSSSNYSLLGGIIEAVTGESYESYVTRILFSKPAHRALQPLHHGPADPPREAQGYARGKQGHERSRPVNPEMVVADGLWSTDAATLARWFQALASSNLVSESVLEEMRRPARMPNGTRIPYGAGVILFPVAGLERFGHGGSMPGFLSEVGFYPATRQTVSLLSNDTGADLSTIEAAIVRAWNDLPSPEFHERSISPEQIRRISGTYDCVERWMRIEGNNSQDLRVVITDPGFDGRVRRSVPVMYLGDGLLVGRSNPEFFEVRFPERSPVVEVQFDSGQLRWLGVPVPRR